tara:strand:+ start:535 stop:789 length:255 start_codon:yes stop_codon:yes gene_type:complete
MAISPLDVDRYGFEEAFTMLRRLDKLCGVIAGNRVFNDADECDQMTEEELSGAKEEYFSLYKCVSKIIAYSERLGDEDFPEKAS